MSRNQRKLFKAALLATTKHTPVAALAHAVRTSNVG